MTINTMIINETEVRHEMRNKNEEIKSLSKKLFKRIKTKNLVITRGKNGALLMNDEEKFVFESPAFANNVVETLCYLLFQC